MSPGTPWMRPLTSSWTSLRCLDDPGLIVYCCWSRFEIGWPIKSFFSQADDRLNLDIGFYQMLRSKCIYCSENCM